ncbi:MAG: CHAP domain-containing protein [Patescibacteria group bacterium]|jgi:surface antigen
MKKVIMVTLLVVSLLWLCSASFAGDSDCCTYHSPNNPFMCTTHTALGHQGDHGNCTWWAAYKRPEVVGKCTGNAIDWLAQARSHNIPTGNIPAVGSIAVFNSVVGGVNYGHVAYVERVYSDDQFQVSEMGYNSWNCVKTREVNRGSYGGLLGFIFPSPVGYTASGWDGTVSPFIESAYYREGGYSSLGTPRDNGGTAYVHEWFGVYLQDFYKEIAPRYGEGDTALIFNFEARDAYLVKEGFWGAYKWLNYQPQYQGRLGAPLNNEYSNDGLFVQEFDGGTLTWDSGYPDIINFYFNDGLDGEIDVISNRIQIASIPTSDDQYSGGGRPILPCDYPMDVLLYDPYFESYYLDLLLNGSFDLCESYNWGSASCDGRAGAGMICASGDDTLGDDNCVFYLNVKEPLRVDKSPYYAQAFYGVQFTLQTTVNKNYLLVGAMRSGRTESTRNVGVALADKFSLNFNDSCRTYLVEPRSNENQLSITNQWLEYSTYLFATKTASDTTIRFSSGQKIGEVYFDDVSLEELSSLRLPKTSVWFFYDGAKAYAKVIYGQGSSIPGFYGVPPSPQKLVVFIDGYGIYDTQNIDLNNGNLIRLPVDSRYKKAAFYLVNANNSQNWFNAWAWQINGAVNENGWLNFSQIIPSNNLSVPKITFTSTQVKVTYNVGSTGNIEGIFDPIDPSRAIQIFFFVDGRGVYDRQDFNLSAGNTFNLPSTFSQGTFYILDRVNVQHWFDISKWQVQGGSANGGWFKWK